MVCAGLLFPTQCDVNTVGSAASPWWLCLLSPGSAMGSQTASPGLVCLGQPPEEFLLPLALLGQPDFCPLLLCPSFFLGLPVSGAYPSLP